MGLLGVLATFLRRTRRLVYTCLSIADSRNALESGASLKNHPEEVEVSHPGLFLLMEDEILQRTYTPRRAFRWLRKTREKNQRDCPTVLSGLPQDLCRRLDQNLPDRQGATVHESDIAHCIWENTTEAQRWAAP